MSDQSVSTPAPPSAALDRAVAKLGAHTDPHISYAIISHDEAAALLARLDVLDRTLAAVERARDVEHRARRSLQQALADLCAQHIGGELTAYRNPAPAAEREPRSLTGYAEKQLDAVDASVFSGECYSTTEGKARMVWYLRRWIKELELNP